MINIVQVIKNARRELRIVNPATGAFLEVDVWYPDIRIGFEFQVIINFVAFQISYDDMTLLFIHSPFYLFMFCFILSDFICRTTTITNTQGILTLPSLQFKIVIVSKQLFLFSILTCDIIQLTFVRNQKKFVITARGDHHSCPLLVGWYITKVYLHYIFSFLFLVLSSLKIILIVNI